MEGADTPKSKNAETGEDKIKKEQTSDSLRTIISTGSSVNRGLSNLHSNGLITDSEYEYYTKVRYPMLREGRLPFHRKMMYIMPIFFFYCIRWQKYGLQKKFYVDDYPNASLTLMAIFIALSVLIDAFTDPKIAGLTDNCRLKFGRRRPFLLVAAVAVPIVHFLLWVPPHGANRRVSGIWFGIFHILSKFADTIFLIPHVALGAQLSPNTHERTNIWAWRAASMSVGTLVGLGIGPILVSGTSPECLDSPQDGCMGMPILSAAFCILFILSSFILVGFGREPTYDQLLRLSDETGETEVAQAKWTEDDTIPMLLAGMMNRNFRIILISAMTKAAGEDVPFTVLPFLVQWVVGSQCIAPALLNALGAVICIVSGIVSIPFWVCLVNRTGKYRAFVIYHIMLGCFSLPFLAGTYDTGDCTWTIALCVLLIPWGVGLAGGFLDKDMASDCIDYDEFLTGGKRREAAYLMAIEFLPKFISIPGETLPLVLMAVLGFHRNPLRREACESPALVQAINTTLSGDAFCDAFFTAEPAGAGWCNEEVACAEYGVDSVKFICAQGECTIKQNGSIVWLVKICFSVIPFFFVLCGLVALYWYPKDARSDERHELLIAATASVKKGNVEEDPWRPGSKVSPTKNPGPNDGALAYFWPAELRSILQGTNSVDYCRLRRRLLTLAATVLFMLLPVGVALVTLGFMDENMDEDWKLMIGIMVLGIALVGAWWQGTRAMAAWWLVQHPVPYSEVIAYLDRVKPFEGASMEQAPEISPPQEANPGGTATL